MKAHGPLHYFYNMADLLGYLVAMPPERGYRGWVLSPPAGLPEAALASALRRWWGMTVASVEYRPVGWGSHHWEVADAAGCRWFVTVDELAGRRLSEGEPLAAAFGRLRASLAAARDLRDGGRMFVVAPVRARDGEPVARVSDGFAVAVYPFIDGQSFEWGEFSSPAHRLGVLGLVAAVHTAPLRPAGRRWLMTSPCLAGMSWRQRATWPVMSRTAGRTRVRFPFWSGRTRCRSGGCWTVMTAS